MPTGKEIATGAVIAAGAGALGMFAQKVSESVIPVIGQHAVPVVINGTVTNTTIPMVTSTAAAVANAAIGSAINNGVTYIGALCANLALTSLSQGIASTSTYAIFGGGAGLAITLFAKKGWLAPVATGAVNGVLYLATSALGTAKAQDEERRNLLNTA